MSCAGNFMTPSVGDETMPVANRQSIYDYHPRMLCALAWPQFNWVYGHRIIISMRFGFYTIKTGCLQNFLHFRLIYWILLNYLGKVHTQNASELHWNVMDQSKVNCCTPSLPSVRGDDVVCFVCHWIWAWLKHWPCMWLFQCWFTSCLNIEFNIHCLVRFHYKHSIKQHLKRENGK